MDIRTSQDGQKRPLRVCITGAAGQIAYSLVFMLAKGEAFGRDQPLIFHLLDIAPMETSLQGLLMEIEDCAFPLVKDVVTTSKLEVAFKDVDWVVMCGAMPRREGMERKDLLKANVAIFKEQGQALAQYASKNVHVLVVGNPANTNALICATAAQPTIPKQNFSALTRLDQNRATSAIARRLNTSPTQVRNVTIWGNHSSTQYPDVSHASVADFPVLGSSTPVRAAVADDEWVEGEFISTIQQRGAKVIAARKLSSAASAANAIVDHLRDWAKGTTEGQFVSMGVWSDGSYGVKEGLIYSFPVKTFKGGYTIVTDLEISPFSRAKLQATEAELVEERDTALEFLAM
jgi:malate dehydrogenase